MINSDTSIRVKSKTKKELENLDFVRKHTYNEIIEYLVEFYKKSRNVEDK
jgi:hypothetical protein